MKLNFKELWEQSKIHLFAIVIFIVVAMGYCKPLLEGKVANQHDVVQAQGMQHEIMEYRSEGELVLWTNSMFSGMPGYQIWNPYPKNLMRYVTMIFIGWLPNPANIIFLLMIGSYILFVTIGFKPYLSIFGAIGYAFLGPNFLFIGAGHLNKVIALGYLPMVVAGAILTFRGKYWVGASFFALALALQIRANHLQMTYYLGMLIGLFVVIELIYQKDKKIWAKATGLLIAATVLASLSNTSMLWSGSEYIKYTIRGERLLTNDDSKDGLDLNYALSYSYELPETFTFLVPNYYGGSQAQNVGKDSHTYEAIVSYTQNTQQAEAFATNAPMYWGSQPISGGTLYFGAIWCFLFLFGMIYSKSHLKWWMLAAVIITIPLGWGRHFMFLTEFFFNTVPLYNKFRDVKMIYVITQFCFLFVGMLGVKELFELSGAKGADYKDAQRKLLIAAGGVIGLLAVLYMFSGSFSFEAASDNRFLAQNQQWLVDAFKKDREAIMKADILRSLMYVVLSAAVLYFYLFRQRDKVTKVFQYGIVAGLTVLVLFDLGGVNKRVFNEDDFVAKRELKNEITSDQVDLAIQQAGANLPGGNKLHYRVFNLTMSPFNDAITSYSHKSVGGYHAVKLRRYQDMIEYHISNFNQDVLDMVNTRFIKQRGQNGGATYFPNPGLGNAWFVDDVKVVETHDEEIMYVGGVAEIAPVDPSNGKLIVRNHMVTGKDTVSVYEPLRLSKDPQLEAKLKLELDKNQNERVFNRFSTEVGLSRINLPLNQTVTLGARDFGDAASSHAAEQHFQAKLIYEFDPSKTAIVRKKEFGNYLDGLQTNPGSSNIQLAKYHPDHMTYEANVQNGDQLAVFSEIYYHDFGKGGLGWKAYIDGKEVEHIRANYILRALRIPEGKHTIEFKFEPRSFYTGEMISLAASLLVIAGFGFVIIKKTKEEPIQYKRDTNDT